MATNMTIVSFGKVDLNIGHSGPWPNNQTGATWGPGEGWGANTGPLEKGIVASRRKIQRGQTQGLGANLRGLGRGASYYLSMA